MAAARRAWSAQSGGGTVPGVKVRQLADAVLGMMSCKVAPDMTTGSLSIDNGSTANADLFLSQRGGGFTWSLEVPLYLEGNAACARFDPVFIVNDGVEGGGRVATILA